MWAEQQPLAQSRGQLLRGNEACVFYSQLSIQERLGLRENCVKKGWRNIVIFLASIVFKAAAPNMFPPSSLDIVLTLLPPPPLLLSHSTYLAIPPRPLFFFTPEDPPGGGVLPRAGWVGDPPAWFHPPTHRPNPLSAQLTGLGLGGGGVTAGPPPATAASASASPSLSPSPEPSPSPSPGASLPLPNPRLPSSPPPLLPL